MLGLDYLIFYGFPEKQTITKSENGFIKRNIFALELKKKKTFWTKCRGWAIYYYVSKKNQTALNT